MSRLTIPAFLLSLAALVGCSDAADPVDPTAVAAPETAENFKLVDPATPYYADLAANYIPANDDYAVVVFKRPPECVRGDFNLLLFFDIPAVFGCNPMVVTGHAIFRDASDLQNGIPPRQEHYSGDAVPIWFAPVGALQAAIADATLTIGELQALAGLLEGEAHDFSQSIRNSDVATQGNGRRPGSSSTVARGELEDGRSFSLHIAETFQPPVRRLLQVRTSFR